METTENLKIVATAPGFADVFNRTDGAMIGKVRKVQWAQIVPLPPSTRARIESTRVAELTGWAAYNQGSMQLADRDTEGRWAEARCTTRAAAAAFLAR